MLKQLQKEPKPGETVEWVHVPKDMVHELNNNWWIVGVQVPNIDEWSTEVTKTRRLQRERRCDEAISALRTSETDHETAQANTLL